MSIKRDSYRLIQDKLQNYSKIVIPVMTRKAMAVDIELSIHSITSYDEVSGVMTSIGTIHLNWTDEMFAWNKSDYNNVGMLHLPISEIWVPPINILNTAELLHLYYDPSVTLAWVEYIGAVSVSIGQVFKTRCISDVKKYPMDKHICGVTLSTHIPESTIRTSFELNTDTMDSNAQWELLSSSVQTDKSPRFHQRIARLYLKRRWRFLLVSLVIPVVFLGVINIFVFIMPPESGERVSYAMTVLLSFAVFLTITTDKLPETGDTTPVFCVYLGTMLCYSSVITLANIIVLIIYNKETKQEEILVTYCHPSCAPVETKQKVGITNTDQKTREMALPKKEKSIDDKDERIDGTKHAGHRPLSKKADVFFLLLFLSIHVIATMAFLLQISM